VSVFEDRWEWIESTLYPEYLDFREQPHGSELQRAAELAEELELDDAAIREWGARPTREGGSVTSPPRDLSGPRGDWSIQLTLLPGGDADDPHARLTVLLVSRDAADADA
jgi:hypothetical protein